LRLWHQKLIPFLPRQQLLGQHRECAALRGNGWGRPHATVNYVFNYSPYKLFQFHMLVINEMKKRGYNPDMQWADPLFRGKKCVKYNELEQVSLKDPIYPEHDEDHLKSCLLNLKNKGIEIALKI
jgi:uncharacterized protein (TIGR02328 family)